MKILLDGYTMMHEHMMIDLSGVKQDLDCRLDCMDEIIDELKQLYCFGVRNIVEVSNRGMARDISIIQQIEQETGIRIIKSTGWYKEPFLPQEVYDCSVEELAQIMEKELTEGIDDTNETAHVIGEIGTSLHVWEEAERKVFDAAILAAKKINCPITTHTTLGTLAYEQASYLIENKIDPNKIIIGHIDLCKDLSMIKKVLELGVNVAFDTVGKNNYFPDAKRVEFLLELEKCNLISQVVMSVDITRKSHLRNRGGIGYTYLFDTFIPMLIEAGMKEESIELMMKLNPARIFGDDHA